MNKWIKNHRGKKVYKRIIAFTMATTMILNSAPLQELVPFMSKSSSLVAYAVTPRCAEVSFNDLNEFAAYSIEYSANPELYSKDTIKLSLNAGLTNTFPSNYIPLGTEDAPFNGKILINQSYGSSWWFETDKPIFDYVKDSAVINYLDEDHDTEAIQIELRRKEKSAITPLFANHVIEGDSTKATWRIKSWVQEQAIGEGKNILVCNTSGLIGEMGENASVTVEYENSAYDSDSGKRSDVEATGNAGLICGTMQRGSRINLTLTGTNTKCLVTSTGEGHAGGLVGQMNKGSVLKLDSTYAPDASRIITANSGYAGGLVGYNDGGRIEFSDNAVTEIKGSVVGTEGAGGICGYYSNYTEKSEDVYTPQVVNVDLKNYDIDCTVKATNAGGLFGVLSGTNNITISGTGATAIEAIGDTVTNFGGIAGTYQTSDLKNTLAVNTVEADVSATLSGTSSYGGVFGKLVGNNAAYVKVDSFTHKSSGGFADANVFGGVIGDAGDQGSMLDIGSVTIETGVTGEAANGTAYKGGGIVGSLTTGVLRVSGTTDLTKAPSSPPVDKDNRGNGQLVGVRKDSLVYAVGSGNNSGWTFNRSTTDVEADDIGTWGSVLRISGIETEVLTFDSDEHTVTVKAPVLSMASAADYTRTALNMQLNTGNKGALLFSDSTNTKTALLGTNLSFSGTIDLAGTGNIGLMRDDYKDSTDEIGSYTKKISGGTVNLAIGERYGSPSTGVGRGDIVAHRYNGLIARTDTGAEVNGITIGGTINVNATIDGTHIGGAVSDAKKGITLTNVTAQEAINFNKISGSSHIVGGVVADVADGNTSISGGTVKPTITLSGNIGDIPIGGTIGKITNTGKTITASSLSIAATINASGASGTDVSCVGFISEISDGSMELTCVTVNGTVINNCASGDKSHSGGFLGMKWLGTDVNFTANNGVILSGTNNSLSTSAKYAAGLVQNATGHWTVPEKGISITGMSITNATNSLGLIVHDGYSGSNGLYLELTHKDSYYLGTGLTIPVATDYDELVRSTGSDILSNGSNGIISITTDGDLIMDGSNCNTYQNKYNKSNVSNSKARYYYNLSSICAKTANARTDGEKLLLWSLKKYAAANINRYFSNAFGTGAITGTFNLEHISYYPIDVDSDLSLGDATFIFYNDKIETSETGTGNSDGSNRTTRGASQHYLMHSGVFRNVSKAALTTSGDIHFKGVIGVDNTYSGTLINGTLSGSLTTTTDKEIVFEGLTLSDATKYLLINKMSSNSKLTLSGVRTGGGKDFSNTDRSGTETKYVPGATVASSLIGDVSGNGIQVSFDRMKLDSRTTAGSPADWSAQYGTTKSIFSGATLLNKFAVDNNSTGVYNFEESVDWSSGTHNANVTYGKEIKTSVEYENKQQKYYDQAHYVDPVNDPSLRTGVYGFDSGFLPYVNYSTATVASGDNATRELKINVKIDGVEEGCGTYNHPYEITLGTQLVSIATAIAQTGYPDKLRLPKIQGSNYATAISNHWCETKNTSCAVFAKQSNNSFKYVENGTTYTWTGDQVSLYLASAYYIIKKDIEITGTYPGLGSSPSTTNGTAGKYAFRGVIVGGSPDGSVKITNKSTRYQATSGDDDRYNTSGLITMSNGCVVKNLTVVVDIPSTDLYNYRSNENQAYGYNENFPNYGAVINKIMGGDNIIDNVKVSYVSTFKVREGNDYKATIGGYVGCVVNGGLIFRNVDDTSLTGFTVKKVNSSGTVQSVTCNGNTITNLTDEKDLIHIHVNPFVGRVINGYAIRESDHYAFSEDGATYGDGETRANAVKVTMHNTRKNYSIPDIDTTNTNKLSFSQSTEGGSYDTITVPDGQALYIMSIIAQSGAGCASAEGGNYAYNISYCGDDKRGYSGNVTDNNKATHWASYSNVGSATRTTDEDYDLSLNDTVNSRTAVPYIIYKYTSSYDDSGTKYPARTLTKRTFYVNLVGGTTYYLPDCFRGIGFLGSDKYVDDNMKIYGFNGNGSTIDFNAEYFTNQRNQDPYYADSNNSGNNIAMVCGLAMFNCLQQFTSDANDLFKYETDSKYQITNFTMQGFISAHHVTTEGADDNTASNSGNVPTSHFCTAGFVAYVNNSNIKLFNISDIMFKGFHINSFSYAGGFIAYTNESSIRMYINNCNADGFKIEGVGRVAGFVGSYDSKGSSEGGIHINTGLDSNGNDSFTSLMKNTIVTNRYKKDDKANYSAGIVGSVWCNTSGDSNKVSTTDHGDHALGTLILRNVTIEGGNAETNYIGNKNDPSGSSGGIMGGGTSNVKGCLIQNCVVKNIDIYGKYAGGIMGENANRNSGSSNTGARIVGCKVTGKLDNENNPQYTIMGLYYAGGVYSDTRDGGSTNAKYRSTSAGDTALVEYKTDIDGVYIYGYNIYSVNESNDNKVFNSNNIKTCVTAGGVIGNNEKSHTIQNCKVEKCVINVGTNASSATNTPCGGLIGQLYADTIYGYNIEIKDCDFYTHQWNKNAAIGEGQTMIEARATNTKKAYGDSAVSGMKCGNVIGNGNSNIANITAIHVENCPAPIDFNSVSGSSFNVYADYNDVASSDDHGVEMSTLSTLPSGYTNAKEGGLSEYFPHVNVSPVIKMGTNTVVENAGTEDETTTETDVILTSDGAALYAKSESGSDTTTPTPVIDAIVNEADSNYKTALPDIKAYIQRALSAEATAGEPNKISTYKTEMGSLPDGVDDFTVLVINSESRPYSTAFINNYIQMVTNTNYDYSLKSNWSSKYNINVYPCTYDGTKYVINASGKTAGLSVTVPSSSDGQYEYYMSNTHADSNQSDYQFSLMDVQFYNPNTSLKEVAYHLYIPVLTKKMLMFEFYSASQSGTDNKAANFTDFGNTLAENLESWYTGYLEFKYSQTELQSILESGAGLNWNGAKTILFKYQTNNVSSKLSGDTQIVLCDPNNSDKYYYSLLSDHRPVSDTDGETDTIRFADFNTKVDGSGDSFEPATLNDMLLAQGFKITAESSSIVSENIYAVTIDPTEADVIASDGTMYKYTKDNTEGITKYKLQISYPDASDPEQYDDSKLLVENYYLAVRAKGNSVYNYSIRTPATTSGGADKPTLRRSNADEGNVTNLIMGSLFTQTVTLNVKNNGTTSSEITSTNHRLDVSLTSTIQLNASASDSEKDYILGHLSNPNIHLYQAFIINLAAKDISENRSEIRGTPSVTTNFNLSGNGNSYTETGVTPDEDITGTFIQLKQFDIKSYLSKTGIAMIKADTQIDFAETWQQNAEFPVQDGSQDSIGVNVSAKSNLSYNEDKVRFSNMTQNPTTPSNQYFYIKESDKASLVFNMKSEILDEYDKVGAPSFNYSQQGINPKNFIDESRNRLPISASATYNATNIKRSDFMSAEKIKYTLKLYKKADVVKDGVTITEYVAVDDVANYIDLTVSNSVFIKVNDGVTSEYLSGAKMTKSAANELTYTADLDQSAFTGKDKQRITADIDFTVITGAGFTEFANYRFVLWVDLLKNDEGTDVSITPNSNAHDWVVYTNAKINPDMLTLTEYPAS